jgi:hypothetical protein
MGRSLGPLLALVLASAATAIFRLKRTLRPLAYAAPMSAVCVLAMLLLRPSGELTITGFVTLHGLFAGLTDAALLIYLMQQAAPGRFVMSHFGLAMGAQALGHALGRPLGVAAGTGIGPIPAVLLATACAAAVPVLARRAPVR